ncbi:MAG: amino acid permease [Gemmatimonadetes bacterium]|jgi:APA family basic amino acid/polyamine antiporter|nr:amino acid permease [Gemmatimonadota bacterium]MBP9105274.1 amino acid permease [Gemmatimonadaceae bacterium]MBK6454631.1 amino acid permease [Gemmatimonadota bacterium]MBK7834513.1 amino acid permease [Gemmatimonadota bacterium]MBK8056735.1 amino acid permease [Gemmatimonadota bacterium]
MAVALKRTLGTTDLTLLVIGNVIGSGIFLVPSSVLQQSGGSVAVASAVWLVGGVLSLLGALSYGELGAMEQGSGGLYAYIRDGFGALPAFLYGWTLFFVIGSGTVATLAVAAANYMGQFAELSLVAKKAIAIGLILLMAVINVRGTRESASVQNVATGIKVVAILVMSLILFTLGSGGSLPASPSTPNISSVGLSIISVLWAYEGWQYVTFVASESVNPQRSLPRAIVAGTLTLIAIYLLANFAYLAALGPDRVAASDRVASEAISQVLGPAAGSVIAIAIIISMYSAAHATVITAPRVYFSMAQDGLFFRRLAEVHPRFGTPALAISANCAWAAVLALTGTFQQLLTYVVFVGWIFYALGAAAVIALRIKRPDAPRPFRVPGYPFTPLIFVLAAAAIVLNTIVEQPMQSAIGIGMVLLGVPAFAFWRSRQRGGEEAGARG